MAIARNFRRYADALLHQLELPFDALRTVQALSAKDFGRLLAAAKRGLLDSSRWISSTKKRKPARAWPASAIPADWWWRQCNLPLEPQALLDLP